MARELPSLELPSWLTVEHVYDGDHEASVKAVAHLMAHPAAEDDVTSNAEQPCERAS